MVTPISNVTKSILQTYQQYFVKLVNTVNVCKIQFEIGNRLIVFFTKIKIVLTQSLSYHKAKHETIIVLFRNFNSFLDIGVPIHPKSWST
jgi:hypothetical protein